MLLPKRRRASPSGAQGNNKGATGRWPALGFNRASVVPRNGQLVYAAESSSFLRLSSVLNCPLADGIRDAGAIKNGKLLAIMIPWVANSYFSRKRENVP
jgi:hypothetical protein